MSDKISLSELEAAAVHPGDPTQQSVLVRADVAQTLIAIAKAALAWSESDCDDILVERMLMDVVAKVRP